MMGLPDSDLNQFQICSENLLKDLKIEESFFHSLIDCDIRAKEGTMYNINFLLAISSAIFKLVKVFPVPQAIIIFPLSFFEKCILALLIA